MSIERVAEMEEFWSSLKRLAGPLDPVVWKNPEMAVAILDTNVYIDHWERGLIATLELILSAIQQWC